MLLWDAAIEEPCFAVSLRFWHAWGERLARPDQRRLYRKSLQWSQSRLLFPGPNGAPLSPAALHNALRRLNLAGELNSIGSSLRKRSEPHSSAGILFSEIRLWRKLPEGSAPLYFAFQPPGSEPACPLKVRIQFRYSSQFFLRVEPLFELFERGISVWDRNPSASKADGVGRQKFNSLDGSQ